ncbi:hypothetical protein AAG906_003578 [Vitis piasezkii]
MPTATATAATPQRAGTTPTGHKEDHEPRTPTAHRSSSFSVCFEMKLHLVGVKGDIGPCKSVPPDVRFRMENSLQEFVNAKKATKEADEYRNPYGPNVSQFEGDMAEGEEEVQEMQSPMAASSGKRKKSTVDKYFAPRNTQGAQPSMRSVLAGKEATWRADMAVGRFFYDACIPTNAVNSFYFKPMLDAISIIGPRYKGPNYYQLRINLLKDAKKEVQLLVDSYRAIWAKVGCTIMGDGWTDNRQRTLINFLVYCPEGISFVKSIDASDIVKDATNLFQLFDEVIEWVGPLNVVHVVTIMQQIMWQEIDFSKHKHINWSPCALILVEKKGRMDEIHDGATRFATTFIALKSLHDHKHDLQALVTSKFFVDSRYSKDYKSQVAVSIILDNRFWNDCLIVVNLMSPLMRLLRIVDCDERPSMGYVYEGMYRENFCNKPNVIGGVMDVIDQKVLKGKIETMNEMRFYNKKRIYDPIDYACIDETDFGRVNSINEVEGSSSHIDDEDGGDMAREGLDVENFGFPNAHFQSPYSNFPNE